MEKPKFPPNEDSRLDTLMALNVLDTPPEERFDRLTRLARNTFEVPIALVSLVDKERQWFKSKVGLDACETSRDISFCGHAILGDEVFIVSDATKDIRFADNPLVVNDPKIRFYAGVPLKSISGENLGTFCIIDRKPRKFSQDQFELLRDLASMAERELAIVHLATVDDLTKIYNRRGFMMIAQRTISFCDRQKLPVSLVYFDLNNFKPINDKYGHAEGDKALILFADHLRNVVRETDVYGRIGGDEFVVLFSDTSFDQAEEIVSRINQSLEQYTREENSPYKIEFSHGTIEYSSDQHESVKALMKMGDALMYERKKRKKDIEGTTAFAAGRNSAGG